MAINITTINGTDSIASSRITINDNFETVKSSMNSLLEIIDITTGKIDNFNYSVGSSPDIETRNLTIRGTGGGGINVITGNIQVGNGNLVIGSTSVGYLQIGGGSNSIKIEKITKLLSGGGNIPTVNTSGTGATGGTGPVGYITLPRLETSTIEAIETPSLGSLVYDIDTNQVKVCTASGATGTWSVLN